MRAAFAEHGGAEIDSQGDSFFFVAFRRAKHAVAAAAAAQRALQAHAWPEGAPLRVRMGVHTGEAELESGRYHGVAVHRGARIMAAAHGGQVLVSQTTSEMLGDEEAELDRISLRDLGLQRLKDLDRPVHLYQLVVEGLPAKFPPARTLGRVHDRRHRVGLAAAALMGVVAAAVAIPIFVLGSGGGSEAHAAVSAGSVAVVNPTSGKVVGDVPNVGTSLGAITAGAGGVWAADVNSNTVIRIDPERQTIKDRIHVNGNPTGLAVAARAVWAANGDLLKGAVYRIDPQYDKVTGTAHLAPGPFPGTVIRSVAGRGKQLWAASFPATAFQINPLSTKVTQSVEDEGGFEQGIAIGFGSIWIGSDTTNHVTRIDPRTGVVIERFPVGSGPTNLAVGAGAVWVANRLEDTVTRIDPETNEPTTIHVGGHPLGIAVVRGNVWVANSRDGTIQKIEPKTNKPSPPLHLGNSPNGIAVADGKLWVTLSAAPFAATKSAAGTGRVARFDVPAPDFFGGLDPTNQLGLGGTLQIGQATCARLFNYPDNTAALARRRTVPEVAASWPTPTDGGKTYTFTIRKGFRFSPPSNAVVTADTFKYTYERAVKLQPWLAPASLVSSRAGSAIKASGNRLTIHLKRPDPILRTELATSAAFCAVPIGTPRQLLPQVPSAGPYYVASYTPFRNAVLKQNPNYGGNRPHRLVEIRYALDVGERRSLAEVKDGAADYIVGTCCTIFGIPPEEIQALRDRYGREAPAAKAGRQQFFENPSGSLAFLTLNTRRPLFRTQRCGAPSTSRSTVRRWQGSGSLGSRRRSRPPTSTCRRRCPATRMRTSTRRDRTSPRRGSLPGRALTGTAVLYTCNVSPCPQQAQVITNDLGAIGIDVQVKQFDWQSGGAKVRTANEPFDLASSFQAFAPLDPSAELNAFLDSNLAAKDDPFENNWARFNSPAYNRRLEAAARLSGSARNRAYARLDADLAGKAAPWAAWGLAPWAEFFSRRIELPGLRPWRARDGHCRPLPQIRIARDPDRDSTWFTDLSLKSVTSSDDQRLKVGS